MRIVRFAAMILAVVVLSRSAPTQAQFQRLEVEPRVVTLPSEIPLFPLRDVVLFPNISRPFHIFEPRYRLMVADVLQGDGVIGMIQLRPGYDSEYEETPPIYEIGCAGVITAVEELADGRYNIVVRGVMKFRVKNEDLTGPYRLARVEALPEVLTEEDKTNLSEQRVRLGVAFESVARRLPVSPLALSDEDLVNGLAQVADLSRLERQALLEQDGPLPRAEALLHLLLGSIESR